MNMMGNFAGFFAPSAAGMIVDAGLGWSFFLYTMVFSYLLGGLCWPLMDPVTRSTLRDENARTTARYGNTSFSQERPRSGGPPVCPL